MLLCLVQLLHCISCTGCWLKARKSAKKVSGSCLWKSLVGFSESPVDGEVRHENTILEPGLGHSSDLCESLDATEVAGEGLRDCPMTVRLEDAVRCRSRRGKRGKRKHFDHEDESFAKSTVSKTSSAAVRRRGKGAVIYSSEPKSIDDDDNDGDFEVVLAENTPRSRSRWLDGDLNTVERRSFACELSRTALGSLEERFGRRATVAGSAPRRCLVDLTDVDEESTANAGNERVKSTTAASPLRLLLVVEELHSCRSISGFGHVACRFVAATASRGRLGRREGVRIRLKY